MSVFLRDIVSGNIPGIGISDIDEVETELEVTDEDKLLIVRETKTDGCSVAGNDLEVLSLSSCGDIRDIDDDDSELCSDVENSLSSIRIGNMSLVGVCGILDLLENR